MRYGKESIGLRPIVALTLLAAASAHLLGCQSSDPKNGELKCGSTPPYCPASYECIQPDGTCWKLGAWRPDASPALDTGASSVDRDGATSTDLPRTEAATSPDLAGERDSAYVATADGGIRDTATESSKEVAQAEDAQDAPISAGDEVGQTKDATSTDGKGAIGTNCQTGAQCANGFCIDGVCCTTKCDGQCEFCKESGSVGTCKTIQGEPVTPRPACVGTGLCKSQCDGNNSLACTFPDGQVTCTPATCSNGKIVTASVCNGGGACTAATTSTCPTNQCATDAAGKCSGSCTAASCGANAFCDPSGACVPTLDKGKTCSSNTQCTSGICSMDGVCCDAKCDGQCESCKETGSLGQCKAVAGIPVGTRTACAGTGACKGTCDATSGKSCAFPGTTTVCTPASCDNGVVTPAATCDGAGTCAKATATTCPYNLCTSNGQCTGECPPGTKKCVGLVPSTCDSTGRWVAETPCDKLCNGGACSGTCVPNSKTCNGQMPQVCDAMATWQDGAACVNQACVGGTCVGTCTPGDKQCSNNGVQTCAADGTWGSSSACNNQACVSGACVGTCTPGAKQCSLNGVQTCTASGAWGSASNCGLLSCENGACIANTCAGNGDWSGCRASGCFVCAEKLTDYPRYLQNHPNCTTNTTCAGEFYTCNRACPAPNDADRDIANCPGTSGQWSGCRASGCHVCAEKVTAYPNYFNNHPGCIRNDTCGGTGYAGCNSACPAPTDTDL